MTTATAIAPVTLALGHDPEVACGEASMSSVLLIEDDPSSSHLYGTMLSRDGHQVVFAARLQSVAPDQVTLTFADADSIREIALRLVPKGPKRGEAMTEVFGLSSSYSPRGVPPEERLKELRALLRSYVK